MKYTVISEKDLKFFVSQVNHRIALGWVLQGGMTMCAIGTDIYYAQAFIER